MQRVVLIASLALAGCFYSPSVDDCAVACTEKCPGTLKCIEGLCRANERVSCECQNGLERACGVTKGQCKAGTQTCVSGAWGACAGEVTASAEVCDGVDNDCDGLVDQFPAVVVVDHPVDAWRFLALDGGFAVVSLEPTDAGLEQTTVRRLSAELQLTQTSTPRVGGGFFGNAAAHGDTVFLAWDIDGGVEVVADEGGQARVFTAVEDAGVRLLLRLGADEQRLVAHWDLPGLATTRLARWSFDGQLVDVTELSTLDAGYELTDGYAPGLSDRGHYAVFTATAPADAGLSDNLRVVVDTRSLTVLRTDAPYYQYDTVDSHLVETPTGALALLYSYQYPADSWSGIYLNRDALTHTTDQEILVEEVRSSATAWGSSHAAVDGSGKVSFVYQDNLRTQLWLARAVGDENSVLSPTRVALPTAEGFGVPRLAYPGVGEFLGLAWYDRQKLSVRRVCPVP